MKVVLLSVDQCVVPSMLAVRSLRMSLMDDLLNAGSKSVGAGWMRCMSCWNAAETALSFFLLSCVDSF